MLNPLPEVGRKKRKKERNVGVSTKQVYEIKRIDSDYFEE